MMYEYYFMDNNINALLLCYFFYNAFFFFLKVRSGIQWSYKLCVTNIEFLCAVLLSVSDLKI